MKINVLGYRRTELERATREYVDAEKSLTGSSDAVLVSVESMASLRRAYPNYFLDTNRFVEAVNLKLPEMPKALQPNLSPRNEDGG